MVMYPEDLPRSKKLYDVLEAISTSIDELTEAINANANAAKARTEWLKSLEEREAGESE